jgi:hypothetical protein
MKPAVGRVYVLSNKAMPGLLKIGYTMNTVEGRVKELSSATGVPSEFFIEYQVECRDAAGVEALVHESFHNLRHNNSREFFSISLADAVDVIRKHAKEIIDEEISGQIDASVTVDKSAVTYYLVRVNGSKNIFRVGLIKEGLDFLNTEEFKSMVIELYNHFDSNFFYECEVVQSKEFFYIDDESLEKMKDLLDGNIKRLKTLNRYIFETEGFYRAKEFHPRLNGKYDLRTLPFKDYKESFPIQIYNSSLSLIDPIAQACLDKNTPEAEKSEHLDASTQTKTIILDRIKEMGI